MKCESCGRAPLATDPEATRALAAELRITNVQRLHRTEAAIYGAGEEARLQMAAFLGKMLERPPLDNPTSGFVPIHQLIYSLWFDIADATPDPLEPMHIHPGLNDHHPWKARDEG
jgi:ABC-type hemin transport system ATPase subunit